jgi:ABC-type multidrug transport system permease subunit
MGKERKPSSALSNIIVFPMLFLSGTFFPRFTMPEWLQHVSAFLPLTPIIDGIRMIATEGKASYEIGPQLGMIAIWAVIIYAIAFRVFPLGVSMRQITGNIWRNFLLRRSFPPFFNSKIRIASDLSI